MPGQPKGSVRGHKLTKPQGKLFGIARGIQEGTTSAKYSPAAAKIAKSIGPKDLHTIASKPKGGYRKAGKK
jgi:hypothetical protein